MDARHEESKRRWAAFVLEETATWPSDKPIIIVEYTVFGLGWEENGIYGVRGKVSVEQLHSIESQLKTGEEVGECHLMEKGEGDYLLAVTYDDGETDDYGRVIHSPYWDMSVIGFRSFDEVMALRVSGKELHRKIGCSATPPGKGHGHVFPRADGVRMRCGGPGMCKECSADLLRKEPSNG